MPKKEQDKKTQEPPESKQPEQKAPESKQPEQKKPESKQPNKKTIKNGNVVSINSIEETKTEAISNEIENHSVQEVLPPKEPEQITSIKLNELHPFKNHPFAVTRDIEMEALVSSVKDKGITQPIVVRPREDGGYEIVSGHRRKMASELAGYESVPCIVRNLNDDEAITQMVEDNTTSRENIKPTERGKALKMQLEAIKHQGASKGDTTKIDPNDL